MDVSKRPTKPYGTECSLYYDSDRKIEAGHYIVSSGGSAYRVKAARESVKRAGRWNLKVWRVDKSGIPDDAVIHMLYWYSRNKTRHHNYQNEHYPTHS